MYRWSLTQAVATSARNWLWGAATSAWSFELWPRSAARVPKCIDPLSSRVTVDGAEVAEGRRHARVVLPEAGLRDLERTAPFFFTAI